MASPKEIAPLLPETLPEDFGDWDSEASPQPSPVHSDEREAWESTNSFGEAPDSLWKSADRDAFLDSLGDKPRVVGSASSGPVYVKPQNGSLEHDSASFAMPVPVSPIEWEAWEAARPFVKAPKPAAQSAGREAVLPPPVDKPRDAGPTSSAPVNVQKQESNSVPVDGSASRASQKPAISRATNAVSAAPSRPKAALVDEVRNSPELAAKMKRDADLALSQLFSPKNTDNLKKQTSAKKKRMIMASAGAGVILLLLVLLVLMFHHGAKPVVKQAVPPPVEATNPQPAIQAPTPSTRKTTSQDKSSATGNQPANYEQGANSKQAPTAKQTEMMNNQLTAPSRIPKQMADNADPTASLPAPNGDGLAGSSANTSMFNGHARPVVKAAPPKLVVISSGVATGMLIRKTEPIYPPIAKAARVSGTVELHAIIAKDGSIKDLHALSGPAMLRGAAEDAVQTWRYKPYKLNNEPTEVETTINVVFTMSP